MSDISNGKGGAVSVTDTAQLIEIVPAPGISGSHKWASMVKVWNTGDSMVYATINDTTAAFDIDSAVPIPPGENFPFRKPVITTLVLACAEGESSTATWGAC